MNDKFLTPEVFVDVFSKVIRLNVDLVIASPAGVVLCQRSIEPYKGFWHCPGGTVYKGETIQEAVSRVAFKETGLAVKFKKCLGYMEFLHEPRHSIDVHTVSIAILVHMADGLLAPDNNATNIGFFMAAPNNIIEPHRTLLKNESFIL